MNWDPILAQIGAWVTALGISGTAGAAAAYGLFKWLGAGWLNNKFSKDLEAFKAQKNEELESLRNGYQREAEHLKAEIGRLFDRATKLHAREYEALPHAWQLLNTAFGYTANLVMRLKFDPDLNAMSHEVLEEFLENTKFSSTQKNSIRIAADKSSEYIKLNTEFEIKSARAATTECQNYTILNGIFFPEEIVEKISSTVQELHKTLIYRVQMERHPNLHENYDKASAHFDKSQLLMNEIRAIIRSTILNVKI